MISTLKTKSVALALVAIMAAAPAFAGEAAHIQQPVKEVTAPVAGTNNTGSGEIKAEAGVVNSEVKAPEASGKIEDGTMKKEEIKK